MSKYASETPSTKILATKHQLTFLVYYLSEERKQTHLTHSKTLLEEDGQSNVFLRVH